MSLSHSNGSEPTRRTPSYTGARDGQSREGQLVSTFVALADTLVADYDVVDLLHTLVATCADLVDATAGGILLADESRRLEVVASTDERSRTMDLIQLSAGEGPCIESFETGQALSVPDISATAGQWPRFAAAAREHGFGSVHAVPLRLRKTTIGSLNLFREAIGQLEEDDLALAQALADVATIGILHERALREGDVARAQLQHALNSRVVLEQAKGVLAQSHGVDMQEAFAMLRNHARSNGLPLAEVASDIVNRKLRL
jgi:transcriptional regulator with GAF, ATPase, and Fis domain